MERSWNFLKKISPLVLYVVLLISWIEYDYAAKPDVTSVSVYEKELTGSVLKVKTEFPYPFTTKEGKIWQCKIRILVHDHEDQEEYIYKAYPLHGSDTEWTCHGNVGRLGLQPGDIVHLMVLMKKPDSKRGEIKWLDVL